MKPLLITVGDPAGIGPEIAIDAARMLHAQVPLTLVGDATRLRAALAQHGVEQHVDVVDAGRVSDAAIEARAPTAEGGAFQLRVLELAIDAAQSGRASAIVTGPISKQAVVLSGAHDFTGHTEHLARRCGLADDAVTMMFLGPRLCTSLVTTHVALRDVPQEVTPARVTRACVHLAEALERRVRDRVATLIVSGLNPHAGEHGLFGDEEARVIEPAMRVAMTQPPFGARVQCLGIRPAEAAFRDAAASRVDGVVAMFHDQATLASKLLDWGSAVNVTWGLPFLRTSVDHGVAYDIAGKGTASSEGLVAAIRMALQLGARR